MVSKQELKDVADKARVELTMVRTELDRMRAEARAENDRKRRELERRTIEDLRQGIVNVRDANIGMSYSGGRRGIDVDISLTVSREHARALGTFARDRPSYQ